MLQLWTISILLGIQPLPKHVPLFDLMRDHPIVALTIGGFLLLLVAVGLILAYRPRSVQAITRTLVRDPSAAPAFPYMPVLALTTMLATVSTAGVVGILGLVLARPGWCPDALCPTLVVEPAGTYDSSMALAFSAQQGSSFWIPNDPSTYSLRNLPPTQPPGAVQVQTVVSAPGTAAANPYRVQISIRNRRQKGFNIFIERVTVVVETVRPAPSPTRAWLKPGGDEILEVNPFTVGYAGQRPGTPIAATFEGKIPGHVRLGPRELDYVTLTVSSTASSYIQFRVGVDYRVTNEQRVHTLILADRFRVIFVDSRNWQPYVLTDGRFVPS